MSVALTDAEWKIMNMLWDRGELTITELTCALAEDTGWSKQTVISFLNRLEAKKAVAFVRKGLAKTYYTLIERETTAANEAKELIDKAFAGSMGLMMNTIVRHQPLTASEIKELEAIVRQLEAAPEEDTDA